MFITDEDTFPKRRFYRKKETLGRKYIDECGLLRNSALGCTMGIADLLKLPIALVVAPPWGGKTYIAERTHRALAVTTNDADPSPFGEFVELTSFPERPITKPSWWNKWCLSNSRACWIVDAIDEDLDSNQPKLHEIIDLLKGSAERLGSLSLVLFCRESEPPVKPLDRLREIYGNSIDCGIEVVKIAPPDREIAEDIARGPEKLSRVQAVLRENDLLELGGIPAVIEALSKLGPDIELDGAGVWRLVLDELLSGGSRERKNKPGLLPDNLFVAAERAAAVITFTGYKGLREEAHHASEPSPNELFPRELDAEGRATELREAAWWMLKGSSAFRRTGDLFVFSQKHIRELFAAFALRKLPKEKLHPLLEGAAGPFEEFRGIAGHLRKICTSGDVNDWLAGLYGDRPSESDIIPSSLRDSLAKLDELLELVHSSGQMLDFWNRKDFAALDAPGLGNELVRRLKGPSLFSAERHLLLEIADATEALEVMGVAEDILRNAKSPDAIRVTASYFLASLGSNQQILRLGKYANRMRIDTRDRRVVLANILRALLERSLWPWVQIAEGAPPVSQAIGDATFTLEHKIKDAMTIDNAIDLLTKCDWDNIDQSTNEKTSASRGHRRHHGKLSLVLHAIELLADEKDLPNKGFAALGSALLFEDRNYLIRNDLDAAVERVAGNQDARRALFRRGAERYPDKIQPYVFRWVRVLDPTEDLDWLAGLAQERFEVSPWLTERLIVLCYQSQVTERSRRRIRAAIRSYAPDVLTREDKIRRKSKRTWQKIRQEDEAAKKSTPPVHQLADVVTDLLSDKPRQPRNCLHNLSWCCLSEDPYRPDNLQGKFQDLPEIVQNQVLAAVAELLKNCRPTKIPDTSSYPAGIVYEANAFVRLLNEPHLYAPNKNEIKKWLPGIFKGGLGNVSSTLERLAEVDRTSTEDVVLAAIHRELRQGEENAFVAGAVPSSLWSERVAARVSRYVTASRYKPKSRCSLLHVLATHTSDRAKSIAQRWLKTIRAGDDGRTMRMAAVDVLLVTAPDLGIKHLENLAADLGGGAITELHALTDRVGRNGLSLGSWSAAALERLTRVFHREFPVSAEPDDPKMDVTWVTPADEIEWLRDRLPSVLFERNDQGAMDALDSLSTEFPTIERYFKWAKANKAAGGVLSLPNSTPLERVCIPFENLLKLLASESYRIIRGPADLQRVILSELVEIGKRSRTHLAMLYNIQKPKVRKNEDALQAYLHCRLEDRLLDRILESPRVTILNRETHEADQRKFDIKVEAPTVDGAKATIVIEIKWSDNKEVSTSLSDQLGCKYLLANHLTHGIYFVALTNKRTTWRQGAFGSRPKDIGSPKAWQLVLKDQAENFKQLHSGICIAPLVFDLRRSERQASGRKKRKK